MSRGPRKWTRPQTGGFEVWSARLAPALAHWNFAALGLSTLAVDVDDAQFTTVREAFDAAGLGIPSVSGTFNMAHPDAEPCRSNRRSG